MLKKIIPLTALAVLATLAIPAKVDAWGAARVSYARVGPGGGVYGGSRTVVAGPRGVYAGGRVGGVGYGGAYRAGYGGAYGGGYRYGYGGYGGGAYGYRYGYIR
jgi:hypothetical protein